MRDPMDELEHFTTPGLTMDPLPAAEVRRRGARLRRRNQALAAVGGVAAVAVIAAPLALAASGTRPDSTPPPATSPSPSVRWVQQVPADFPLADGLPAGAQVDEEAAPSGLSICGADVDTVVSDAPTVADVAGATTTDRGSEGTETRTLTLYDDESSAAAATGALQDLVAGCATGRNGAGDDLVNTVAPADLGGDESYVVTQQAKGSDGLLYDLTTLEVVRTGNAVYVVSSHTSAGGQQVVDGEVQRLTEKSAAVVDAMCIFSTDPC